MGGDLLVALIELGGMARALGLEQLPASPDLHVARRFHRAEQTRSGFADNRGEEFDAPFVRLDWIAPDHFNIQWHRHTGAWFCLYRGKTLAQALKLIETDGILQPN